MVLTYVPGHAVQVIGIALPQGGQFEIAVIFDLGHHPLLAATPEPGEIVLAVRHAAIPVEINLLAVEHCQGVTRGPRPRHLDLDSPGLLRAIQFDHTQAVIGGLARAFLAGLIVAGYTLAVVLNGLDVYNIPIDGDAFTWPCLDAVGVEGNPIANLAGIVHSAFNAYRHGSLFG